MWFADDIEPPEETIATTENDSLNANTEPNEPAPDSTEAMEGENELSLEPSLEQLVADAYEQDQLAQDLIAAKNRGIRRLPPDILARERIALGDLSVRDGRLWINNSRLYVPDSPALRLRIMEMHHKDRLAGYPGPKAMYRLLLRNYY
jgi:hypothetical protein